jgi:methionine biosynthesis protein MetW
MSKAAITASPDTHAVGVIDTIPEALRYDWCSDDPTEVAGILRDLMPPHSRVLDIGCGSGAVTLAVNWGKNNDLWGIEPDPTRAAVARSRGINVTCGTLDRKFVDSHAPFDAIMLADVLEHMAAPGEFLELALDALKPGGLILVSVPNVAHWTVRFGLLFGQFEYTETGIRDATHLRWFTKKTIRQLCQNYGLKVLSVRHSAGNDLPEYRKRVAVAASTGAATSTPRAKPDTNGPWPVCLPTRASYPSSDQVERVDGFA